MKAPITVGAYGRFVGDKGFDRLIGAMNALGDQREVRLLLGGFGPDEQKLKRLAGSRRNISFYGQIDRVDDFLGRCDLVAIPSKYEAYGLVATEARLAARPLIVSGVGGLPEQVGDAGLIVDFEDEASTVKLLKISVICHLYRCRWQAGEPVWIPRKSASRGGCGCW
nr:glycosyltransferase [Sphingopyxis sp. BSNA05]